MVSEAFVGQPIPFLVFNHDLNIQISTFKGNFLSNLQIRNNVVQLRRREFLRVRSRTYLHTIIERLQVGVIMAGWTKLFGLWITSSIFTLLVAFGVDARKGSAQIVPDATLGNERSSLNSGLLVTKPTSSSFVTLIQGGALRGANLFHSFSDFNVTPGQTAYFTNPAGVTTIFTRVTGTQVSLIDGTLGIDGNAKLFILNPNGITFGKSTILDLKSDFAATTVESVKFGNNYIFSATNPTTIPEIAFNSPFGLQLGQVKLDVQIDTPRGNIVVQGNIVLSNNVMFISEGGIDTSRGSIGKDISNAEARILNRVGSNNNISLEANGNIKTGNILSSNSITMISHGGYIDTTFGRLATQVGTRKSDTTNRGNITLNAKDKIISESIDAGGVSLDTRSIFSKNYNIVYDNPYSQEFDFYRSGTIEMTAPYIEIIRGAKVSTSNTAGLTRSLSDNDFAPSGVVPGNIIITANKSLVIGGVDDKGNVGGIFSESIKDSFTLPGTIKISTGDLIVNNSGVISIRSASEIQMNKAQMALADRANIKIEANSVVLQNGGKITTSTSRYSNSGSIEINARNGILLSGKDSGLFANTEASSSGIGGDIRINPQNITPGILTLQDGAGISVNSRGSGAGGNLDVNAKSLTLSNSAFLSSETDRANGGNLNLNVDGVLLLRRNSVISTSAGTAANASAVGKSGDIDIKARFVIAPSYENSDIKANAFNGEGGTVNINSEKVFGMFVRSRNDLIRLLGSSDPKDLDPIRLGTSDITAISQNNPTLNGSVEVSQLEVDPTRGLNAEPLRPQKPNVSEDCGSQNQAKGSRVTSSGRGGITPTPSDSLTGSMIWQDPKQSIATAIPLPPENTLPIAQGWIQNSNGTVLLIGSTAPISPTATCQVR